MGKKKTANDPYRILSSDSSSSGSGSDTSAGHISQEKNESKSEPISSSRNDHENLSKKWSPLRKKHTRTKSADSVDANIIMPATRAVLDDLREASAGGFPQFEAGESQAFSKVTSSVSNSKQGRKTPDSMSDEKISASAISYFKHLPPPPPPPPPSSGILRLTQNKQKRSPKVTSSGVVKYNISENSDVDSEASSISTASDIHGYAMPFPLQKTKNIRQVKLSNSSESSTSDDDLSIRTPIPKAPPDASRSAMPDAFLRDHHLSASESNLSDLSEEEESVAKRHKRELKNVGRLVQAAKQQQSFAQAWFSAGKGDNVLPQLQPKNRPQPKSIDDVPSGPIDLDSGESWEEPGGFSFIAKSNTDPKKRFISFGGGFDSDRRCCGRMLCTIWKIRCTLWVFLLVAFLILGLIAGSTIAAVMLHPSTLDISSTPSFVPTVMPSSAPTGRPSRIPSITPSTKPSSSPSLSPSLTPTNHPSDAPTRIPSYSPSKKPSASPSISQKPSLNPTGSPTTFFSATKFEQVGGDINVLDSISNDRNGHSVKLSKDSMTMVVGSLIYPNVLGSVRVYERLNSQSPWITKGQRILGSQSNSGAGEVVDISDDGTRIAMSEYVTNGGIVKVFDYNSETLLWEQVGSNIEGMGGDFGFSLSMSGDGQRIAVGAYANEMVIVYTLLDNLIWADFGVPIQETYFGGKFGWSVNLSKDGNVLAIGAPAAAGDGVFFPEGYVSVYEFNGIEWTRRGNQILYRSVFEEIQFGFSVSLNEDGSVIAIGANQNPILFEGINSFPSGSVSVYTFIDRSWRQVGNDLLGAPSPFQEFGYSVALSRDGKQVVIGAPYSSSGKVFFYRYNGYIWEEARVLDGQNTDEFFGFAIDVAQNDVSGCLSLIAVGAPGSALGKGVLRTYGVNYIGPCS